MKKRNLKGNNKGFTLVELIVVLVILAILAAILVPALLGYIDQARTKQTLLNARSAMTAAQAEMSAIYGSKDKTPSYIVSANQANVEATADFAHLSPVPDTCLVGCVKDYDTSKLKSKQHDAFTISTVYYKDASTEVWYYDGQWYEAKPDGFPADGDLFQIYPKKSSN